MNLRRFAVVVDWLCVGALITPSSISKSLPPQPSEVETVVELVNEAAIVLEFPV